MESKSIEMRKVFAKAVAAGTARGEVMRRLGIAQATYYQWHARLRKYKERWVNGEQITRAIRIPKLTVEATHDAIQEFSLQHPTLGPKQLALELVLSSTVPERISASTIHSILQKRHLSQRSERAAELHRQYLAGKNPLTTLQNGFVEQVYPMIRWKGAMGRCAGEVLTHDIVTLHHSNPLGVADVSIIVDTFDSSAFARFLDGSGWNVAVEGAREAIEYSKAKGYFVQYMYTDRGHEFGRRNSGHRYNKYLKGYGIVHRLIDPPDNRRNPFAKEVWAELEKFLFRGGVANPASYRGRVHELNPVIRGFLDKRFGRVPPQAV